MKYDKLMLRRFLCIIAHLRNLNPDNQKDMDLVRLIGIESLN